MADVKTIYQGRVITLNEERVKLPNDVICNLEIVRHPGGAAVVAINENKQVCLLKQYRHAAGGWLWELPAGKLESEEPAEKTAIRELREEAGVIASQWQDLGKIVTSPGVLTEIIYLYLARDLEFVAQEIEEDEVIESHWVNYEEALAWVQQGKIEDAKTIIGLYKALQFI